mgnify:CR=1 FL=1
MTTMPYTIYETHRNLQTCPKCGKLALAQPRENYYRCLWCGFESNVSDDRLGLPQFLVLIFLGAVVFAIALSP